MSKKEQNNVESIWKQNDVKIVFSNPEIQAWESVVFVKDTSDILYYYYTVTAYRRKGNKWKKEFVSHTLDFATLLNVERIAEELLKDDFDDGSWQMASRGEGSPQELKCYKKSFDTDNIVNEDYYRMERIVRFDCGEKAEEFNVTIGAGNDPKFYNLYTDAMPCVIFNTLTRGEFLGFISTVKEFISKSIQLFNEIQKENLSLERGARKIVNGKMYEYSDACCGRKLNILSSIYVPGDEVFLEIKGKHNDNDVFIDFKDCRLAGVETSKIGNGYITITGGYKQFKSTTENIGEKLIKIPVELIVCSFASIPDERIQFNEDQYVEDFFSIMSAEEKKEFATTPLDDIIKKWFYAIVDRSWLSRKEHGFKNEKKTTKRIIKKIKKKCEKEILE